MVKLDIVICTYNREYALKENLRKIKELYPLTINKLILVNNGNSFCKLRKTKWISIINNINLGGSGGYARGLYEAAKSSSCTHILLMDDDIKIDVNSIIKAKEIIEKMENKDWLGFGMLPFDNPSTLYESGAYWTGYTIKHNNKGLSINSKKDLNRNLKYNYSAWWSLIMPVSVVKDYGYPFPFFIKFDDIEYGLRRKADAIRFDKNINIKHEPFRNKYNPSLEYYNLRNAFITNSLHFKNAKFLSLIRYLGKFLKLYFKRQFVSVKMANLGSKEYFIGPNLFIDNNIEDINKRITAISKEKINTIKCIIGQPIIAIYYCFKIITKYNKAKKEYLKQFKYLTSEEYWLKQFGIKK